MNKELEPITEVGDWYARPPRIDHTGAMVNTDLAPCAQHIVKLFDFYKREMEARIAGYEKYEKQAAAEVVSQKKDLPNISSGESAGFIRRMARNTVQHTPNVFVNSKFDDDSLHGRLAEYLLKSKIIGDDEYSNSMQQNLSRTARRGFTLGFDTVIPVLEQNALGQWKILYDQIHYRDVYPEPGAKDVRRATQVFIRRYLTKGEVRSLIKNQTSGWDIPALIALSQEAPASREYVDHESKKHKVNTEAYEIITWYSASGDPFLTFDPRQKRLLRIEKNKHPLKEHPVHFFIPEVDDQQPFGKSLLSLSFGRQEFQDLFMNGAMKLWIRNLNPPIIGYGTVNAVPNLGPGKYTQISNPNAKIEPFEVNTQALMMFQNIAQGNAGNMAQMLGATDQQMAAQSTGGMMSQTPQGVEAQQQMVDITTNGYQKAMEAFFSKYCSYALTIYFQELKGVKSVTPSADARKGFIDSGIDPALFLHEEQVIIDEETGKKTIVPADGTGLRDGDLKIDFSEMAVEYHVQVVPGSLIEMEDEKEIRILNEMFIPLSQAMPAIAASGDQEALRNATAAMQYIIKKQMMLSGSKHKTEIEQIFSGKTEQAQSMEARQQALEDAINGQTSDLAQQSDLQVTVLQQLQEQVALLAQSQAVIGRALGLTAPEPPTPGPGEAMASPDAPAPGAPQTGAPAPARA